METKTEVYCTLCQYLFAPKSCNGIVNVDNAICKNPKNAIPYDNWYSIGHEFKQHPRDINKSNNCASFKEITEGQKS